MRAILCIVAALILSVCSAEPPAPIVIDPTPRIDSGSSAASIAKVRESLSAQDQKLFDAALLVLEDPGLRRERTGQQIIQLARSQTAQKAYQAGAAIRTQFKATEELKARVAESKAKFDALPEGPRKKEAELQLQQDGFAVDGAELELEFLREDFNAAKAKANVFKPRPPR